MPSDNSISTQYVGRFAPSPSGELHFGSLVAALASYLQAKANHGKWLLRIEDIDPPREVAGAADAILRCLEAHGLDWDEQVSYQSQHNARYDQALADLMKQGHTYLCECTRKQIRDSGGIYQRTCRTKGLSRPDECAIRIKNQHPISSFDDLNLGPIECDSERAGEDFVLKRKDGLYAYHLAVVLDDIQANVNEIVRGADLLETTACHLALYDLLATPAPRYLHIPVAVTRPGHKLSKQNHAQPISHQKASNNLGRALAFLGHPLPASLRDAPTSTILEWAVHHWQIQNIPKTSEIILSAEE